MFKFIHNITSKTKPWIYRSNVDPARLQDYINGFNDALNHLRVMTDHNKYCPCGTWDKLFNSTSRAFEMLMRMFEEREKGNILK